MISIWYPYVSKSKFPSLNMTPAFHGPVAFLPSLLVGCIFVFAALDDLNGVAVPQNPSVSRWNPPFPKIFPPKMQQTTRFIGAKPRWTRCGRAWTMHRSMSVASSIYTASPPHPLTAAFCSLIPFCLLLMMTWNGIKTWKNDFSGP